MGTKEKQRLFTVSRTPRGDIAVGCVDYPEIIEWFRDKGVKLFTQDEAMEAEARLRAEDQAKGKTKH